MSAAVSPAPRRRDGILLLDKQPGMTSFDCIRALKKSWKRTDLGHGGTLDKFASGLLPVLFGEGLKLVRFFLESYPALPTYWKTYEGVFELGKATETGDPEGAVIEEKAHGPLSVEAVQAAMGEFTAVASYHQTPPRYSAKKLAGERASDLARAGLEPQLKPVAVTIRRFECLGVDGGRVRFRAECSKGTYIRVLGLDLARKLNTVAYVSELRRTAVGNFGVEQAVTLADAEAAGEDRSLLDLRAATAFLPTFPLIGGESENLIMGKVDGVAARLANSGLTAGVYCATAADVPAGLLELSAEKHATFLRRFT